MDAGRAVGDGANLFSRGRSDADRSYEALEQFLIANSERRVTPAEWRM
ncbi:MAG TPA: hypothetical protein VK402_03980 [Blastococcus sp.]|nr:hypothetical protein [Blastococcus sp.]